MDPLIATSSMILLVVLMLSAEAASRAMTSTVDPEMPSGNDSEPLRAGLGLEVRREAGKSLLIRLRRSGQAVPDPGTVGAHGSPQFTSHSCLFFFANAITQTFSN